MTAFRNLLNSLPEEFLSMFQELENEIKQNYPPIYERGSKVKLRKPSDKLNYGITREGDKYKPILYVDSKNSRAFENAKKLSEKFNLLVDVEIIPEGFSIDPQSDYPFREDSQSGMIYPGASISHNSGYPGTVGCMVTFDENLRGHSERKVGLISVSHVLSRRNNAKKRDTVLVPGHPDAPRIHSNIVGNLFDYSILNAFSDSHDRDYDNIINSEGDLALVEVTNDDKIPEAESINLVPDPKNSDNKIRINSVATNQEILERYLERDVYKVGRTTGFTSGTLHVLSQDIVTIKFSGQNFLFVDTMVVKNKDKKSFSRPGDSGSLVYAEDGTAIGLVIAGSSTHTYVCPLQACLERFRVNAQIYDE